MTEQIQCTEVWGGTGSCDVSVKLAGVRGEVFSQTFDDGAAGGDIHFLSVCGMSILSKCVIADVSGHGEATAEVSEVIHNALIENIHSHDNTSMLSQVNDAFLQRRQGEFRFTTMVSLIFDSRDRSLVYAYAGHPSIMHGSKETGRFVAIEPEDGDRGGIPLGIVPGTSYQQHFAQLEQGDVIAIYTDAFTEARGADGEMLGEEGFARLLASAGSMAPDEIKTHVLEAVSGKLDDDASLVVLEVL